MTKSPEPTPLDVRNVLAALQAPREDVSPAGFMNGLVRHSVNRKDSDLIDKITWPRGAHRPVRRRGVRVR